MGSTCLLGCESGLASDQGWGAMTSILFSSPQAAPDVTIASLDDHLIERMRQNDEHAYRLLVERHIDRAYGLALRILRRPADAEDVAQEAFVKAWINRDKWQAGRAKFSTWLYRVIVNRCIDLQRAPRNEWLDDAPEPVDDAEDCVTSIQRQQVYEDRRIQHPADGDLRDDLRKPEKVVSPGGRVSIAATRDAKDHADHFWAFALAVEAASSHVPAGDFIPVALDDRFSRGVALRGERSLIG